MRTAIPFVLVLVCTLGRAQTAPPQPVQLAPGLFRLQGTDPATGTEFVRFFLASKYAAGVQAGLTPQHTPDFIVECTQLNDRRKLSFFLAPVPVEDIGFHAPVKGGLRHRPTPKNPTVMFKMTFDGYVRSKPFKTAWEKLPTGMYRYRDPSFRGSNLEDPRFFVQYLNSLPTLEIAPAKPGAGEPAALSFDTSGLLQQIARAPLCQP